MNCVSVAVDIPGANSFDYQDEEQLTQPGQLVAISLGTRTAVGVVLGPGEGWVAPEKVKPLHALATQVIALTVDDLLLAEFASQYYQRGLGETLIGSLPKWLREPRNLMPSHRGKRLVPAVTLQQRPFASRRTATKASDDSPKDGEVDLPAPNPRQLTLEQQHALAQLSAQGLGYSVTLLHGVTGSGKTEVYLQRIAEILADQPQAQVLVMTPEIGLTPQLVGRIAARFPGYEQVVLHSNVPDRERAHAWLRAASGQARIVVGTRLSVFTPMPNLSLIILDEEHDTSYKQQEGVRYNARDLAVWRARQRQVPILLGSATPSLETWRHACSGRYQLISMRERAHAQAQLPTIRIVPTRGAVAPGGLSPSLIQAIERRISARELSLVFYNRRGYAPVLACPSCDWVSACPQCTASPVLHRYRDRPWRMICHHCGVQQRVPARCPRCGDLDLAPIGRGTQRLEDELTLKFPQARILRLDRDSMGHGEKAAEALVRANEGDVDIIVGTQMLAKGHDLPRATLAAIVDPDAALFSHDFRAPEHLFALLLQVAGRAGRADRAGEVLIQTRFPEHPIFAFVLGHDYAGMAGLLLSERQALRLPPYAYQAMLRIQMNSLEHATAFLTAQTQAWHGREDVVFHAPLPMSPACVGKKWRAQVLIESNQRTSLQAALRELRAALPARTPRYDWHLDVDPLWV